MVGSILAALLATFFGWSTSRRLLRPLSRVADAAGNIASGGLDTRLEEETDPDLNRLAGSFNDMADAVQERIEREQRFASDVSHELRSPITALTAAVEVLDARRDDLPDRSQQALDVVVGQVRRFDAMVIDLLELSRLDAGATDLNPEEVDLVDLCDKVSQRYGYGDLPIEVHRRARREALVDRVRFERILGNLLENASTHGGGPVRITIEPSPVKRSVLMAVEDQGPGVAASERAANLRAFRARERSPAPDRHRPRPGARRRARGRPRGRGVGRGPAGRWRPVRRPPTNGGAMRDFSLGRRVVHPVRSAADRVGVQPADRRQRHADQRRPAPAGAGRHHHDEHHHHDRHHRTTRHVASRPRR